MEHVFVALPGSADGAGSYEKTFLRDDNGKKVRQVLWGDWLTLAPDMPQTGEWRWIRWAWKDEAKRRLLKIRASEVTDRRPLEMIFLDVGIGDGSVLITPERATDPGLPAGQQERVIVVDFRCCRPNMAVSCRAHAGCRASRRVSAMAIRSRCGGQAAAARL